MNNTRKTYGIVINMDYAHQPVTKCQELWHNIAEKMLDNDFRIEKRMFMMTTSRDKEKVYDKARNVLDSINRDIPDEENIFHYLSDFFTVDMTEYVDLRFPDPAQGIELYENDFEQIFLN